MSILMILLIAVSLSMDAFAVSVSNGIALGNISVKDTLRTGGFFGVFQFIMPVLGWIIGTSVKSYIEAVDHWIAFGLLLFIGGNMIKEALYQQEEEKEANLSTGKLFLQAVATSIDALAVGISFAVLNVNIWQASAIIGVVCFCISVAGCHVGKNIGNLLKEKAEFAGGAVLIAIGLKILAEHLFF
jgi:manganese efflux pump family protein